MKNEEKNNSIIRLTLLLHRLIDGNCSVIMFSRELTEFRFTLQAENDPDFLLFRGIESESDDLPFGQIRLHWSPEALQIKDKEIEFYEKKVKDEAVQAAKRLLEKYCKDS